MSTRFALGPGALASLVRESQDLAVAGAAKTTLQRVLEQIDRLCRVILCFKVKCLPPVVAMTFTGLGQARQQESTPGLSLRHAIGLSRRRERCSLEHGGPTRNFRFHQASKARWCSLLLGGNRSS